MNTSQTQAKTPSWWDEKHTSAWERAKEALRRDWEQTKADFSDGGTDLNQGASDTLRQALGKQALPPAQVPNPDDAIEDEDTLPRERWETAEPALRYGYGAREQFGGTSPWDDDLEKQLESDWDTLGSGRSWDDVRHHVRRGWAGRL